jgi:hypothetical protein
MDVLCKICAATNALKRSEESKESSGQKNQERIIGNRSILVFKLLGILVYNILTKHMIVLCKVCDASPAIKRSRKQRLQWAKESRKELDSRKVYYYV